MLLKGMSSRGIAILNAIVEGQTLTEVRAHSARDHVGEDDQDARAI